MASYSIASDGTKTYYSRYERSGVLSMKAIFPDNFDVGKLVKLKGTGDKSALHGTNISSALTRQIFYACMMVILDHIAAGDIFVLPGTTGANISLKKTPVDEVKRMRKAGLFTDIDIVKSGFNIPRFTFDFGPKYTRKDRQIYVPKYIEQKAFRNVESGIIPWVIIRKTLNNDNTIRKYS